MTFKINELAVYRGGLCDPAFCIIKEITFNYATGARYTILLAKGVEMNVGHNLLMKADTCDY